VTWLLDKRPLKKVLVSRLRYLGDVIMSTVVLDVLKEGDPGLELGFLCEAGHGVALRGHPQLDHLHLLGSVRRGADAQARGGPGGQTAPHPEAAGYLDTLRHLRQQRYDLAVDLFFNPRSAWLLRLSGIPRRIGGTRRLRRHLYTHTSLPEDLGQEREDFVRYAPGGLGHHLSRLLPLQHQESGQSFGDWFLSRENAAPSLPHLTSPEMSSRAASALAELNVDPARPFLVCAPGATWPSKEWPLARWRALLDRLVREGPGPVVVLAPPQQHQPWSDLGPDLFPEGGGILPRLGLEEVLGLLGRARQVVTVDGGIMHAAVGLGVPTVALFGPTRPDVWFPYAGNGPFRILGTWPHCHPCHLHSCAEFICLPDLDDSRVHAEILDLWGAGGNSPAGGGV
jgi:heptosyltransferase-1